MIEPAAPAAAARMRAGLPNGWWGTLVLLATEGALFGCLIASYFYLRFETVDWPPPGAPEPTLVVPLVLTAVLVATSLPLALAAGTAKAGQAGATRAWLAVGLVLGSGYLAMQLHRFAGTLAEQPPQQDAYSSIVTTLSGAHHAHVLVGLLLVLFLLVRTAPGLSRYRVRAVRGVVLYWHGVNVLALAVTGTLLSAAA